MQVDEALLREAAATLGQFTATGIINSERVRAVRAKLEALLPKSLPACVFCGGECMVTGIQGQTDFWVVCDSCLARGPRKETREDAIAAYRVREVKP